MNAIPQIATALILCSLAAGCKPRELRAGMTMLEAEQVLGKPDRAETVPGTIERDLEHPTVIRWYFAKFPVTDSGERYGRPGHINFVPKRFIDRDSITVESDKTARQYGEQSDAYRTFSYAGSFPTKSEYWGPGGSLDVLPVKTVRRHTE